MTSSNFDSNNNYISQDNSHLGKRIFVNPDELKNAIKSLRTVYPSLNIKKGDNIFGLHSFAIYALYGPVNWHYTGQPHFLVNERNSSMFKSFLSFF